ncbi:alcohol dehydrogenase catalytic domain-containing protein [Curtobacterium sp. VKM Ac-2887]|uniref:alcohol dehydrogenase catalytic domain-containing protein n=1 Tax=Curtobacterium sp. VKM Ac-2887 TaxID=2783819 RepID=UPI00188A7FDF|nr:zinc-binding dehydrogenase [Curtobacterium sp. VKM Ac-2887]MBF4588267.1 alcohol dehydrogenase catalytic domain-containing protein [Curtobacterium sp. VKM Ac-2887]
MQAWQFTRAHVPLALNEVPEPTVVPGSVLVDVKAVGLCHSDVGVLEGETVPLPDWVRLPLTLGHEIAGVVVDVGEGVSGWRVGDRVGLCPHGEVVAGLTYDGGYASKVIANPNSLVRIPDRVSFEQAAAATDAGSTAHRAVLAVGQVERGSKVGIIGLGGLGQIGVRIAVLKGAEVYVADVKESVWPMARGLGATRCAADIGAFAEERLDVIVDFAGYGDTTATAVETVRHGGRVVQVGIGQVQSSISTGALVLHQVTLTGVLGGSTRALRDVYDLIAAGALTPVVTAIAFEDIPAGLDRLSEGTVRGRLVATMTG